MDKTKTKRYQRPSIRKRVNLKKLSRVLNGLKSKNIKIDYETLKSEAYEFSFEIDHIFHGKRSRPSEMRNRIFIDNIDENGNTSDSSLAGSGKCLQDAVNEAVERIIEKRIS